MHAARGPDAAEAALLLGAAGRPLARYVLRDLGTRQVAARFEALTDVADPELPSALRRELAGFTVVTEDAAVARALTAAGLPLERDASDLVHDLGDLPAVPEPPTGYTASRLDWEPDLAALLAAAYAPPHPDAERTVGEAESIRAQLEDDAPPTVLRAASARVAGPSGGAVGMILCVFPVSWAGPGTAWVANVAVHPTAQGRGIGRLLLVHALRAAADDGRDALGLSVTADNPARRLYEAVGFRLQRRLLGFRIP